MPNHVWERRPDGQLEKCAEAAALRRAFPEELGNEYTAEEMEGQLYYAEREIAPPQKASARPTTFADLVALKGWPAPRQSHNSPADDIAAAASPGVTSSPAPGDLNFDEPPME